MTPSALMDDAGQSHQPALADARILSLVPSLTELLFDMDLTEQLVGRTSFCIHPKPSVNDIPSVGGTKRINMEKVAALAPTHALVNVDETPKQMADSLAALGIAVIVTHPIEAADNRRLFELIGSLFDRREAAERLIAAFGADLGNYGGRLDQALSTFVERRGTALESTSRLLSANSFERVLDRGFALVTTPNGRALKRAGEVPEGADVTIRFADASRTARMDGAPDPSAPTPAAPTSAIPDRAAPKKKAAKQGPSGPKDSGQDSLF